MAIEDIILNKSFVAAEDLSSYQFHAVVLASNTTVRLMNAATDVPIGILQNAPASGGIAEVALLGISKMKANAAIAVGTPIKAEFVDVADNGKADAADTHLDIGIGHCVFASGAEDDLISVFLTGPQNMALT